MLRDILYRVMLTAGPAVSYLSANNGKRSRAFELKRQLPYLPQSFYHHHRFSIIIAGIYTSAVYTCATATSLNQDVALLGCENFFSLNAHYYYELRITTSTYFSHLLFGLHFSLLVCMKRNKASFKIRFHDKIAI